MEGIALAKKKGVYKGRKPVLSTEQVEELKKKVGDGIPKARASRDFNIS